MIAQDDLGGLLKTLNEDLAENSALKNELVGHTRQFTRVNTDLRTDNLDYQESIKATNRISNNLLKFIDELAEDDLSPAKPLRDTYFERILVVVADETRKNWMSQFFTTEYFPNLSFHVGTEMADTATYQIVIFDNMLSGPEKPDNWGAVLLNYLNHPGFYLLYLGTGFNADVAKYPTKAYATNTIFSIYARLREMVEFMKYFPGHGA